MVTVNPFVESLTLSDVEKISFEFLKGHTDLYKSYKIRLESLNKKRVEYGLEELTKSDSVEYRINHLKTEYDTNYISNELFEFFKSSRMSSERWSGFDLLDCHFNARDYVKIFRSVVGSSNYRKISEQARLYKISETDTKLYGGIGLASEQIRESAISTNLGKYGVDNAMKSDVILNRIKSPFSDPKVRQKAMMTKSSKIKDAIVLAKSTGQIQKSLFGSSYEFTVFEMLVSKFGMADVFYQYGRHPYDDRYPYNCDFYIKSMDLFIELNIHPSHGGSWYIGTDEDKLRFDHLSKSSNNSAAGKLKTWGERDVEKRLCAERNNLKYLVFWDDDLFDFMRWFDDYDCDFESFSADHKANTY